MIQCHLLPQSSVSSVNGVTSSEIVDDVIICDVTDEDAEVTTAEITEDSAPRILDQGDVEIVEVEVDNETEVATTSTGDAKQTDPVVATAPGERPQGACSDNRGRPSSALQLNKPSGLSLEDPMKMMDSILNESGAAISQNINLLGKLELMDYLDSIDCSLEDFQAMLYGKQFSIDPDALEESLSSRENTEQLNGSREEDKADKQLIQYTSCPLTALLDGCTQEADLDLPNNFSATSPIEAEPPTELLESQEPLCSSLIRLEPLTEAEASEETLFYLCELSPNLATTDTTQLDLV